MQPILWGVARSRRSEIRSSTPARKLVHPNPIFSGASRRKGVAGEDSIWSTVGGLRSLESGAEGRRVQDFHTITEFVVTVNLRRSLKTAERRGDGEMVEEGCWDCGEMVWGLLRIQAPLTVVGACVRWRGVQSVVKTLGTVASAEKLLLGMVEVQRGLSSASGL